MIAYQGIWRLIDTGSLDGPTNMAIDEALLENFDPQASMPVLRLYGWSPPALSLGRFQNAAEVLDLEHCASQKVPVVRRITGGGVIYHAEEITYSIVCAPHHIPAIASVKESFRILTSFIVGFYRALQLEASYAVEQSSAGARLGERTAFCFAGRESYDILVAGRKIGGNAQRRLKHVIFQHGSIPLRNHAGEGVKFLLQPPAGIDEEVAGLAELGVTKVEDALKVLLVESFKATLGRDVERGALTTAENCVAQRLIADRYGNERWNLMAE